jgi:tRNA threonylcarbamoyladenosine biosynthesis protein TsaE
MAALGRRLAAVLRPGDLVVLNGALGAGKTTLVQGIGAGLGVRGPVTSPTFVIARVHPSLTGGPALVHADAYRLASPAEVDDLDLDASLETSVTVVEWGGGLVEGLAADRLEVSIALAVPAPEPAGPGGEAGSAGPGSTGPGSAAPGSAAPGSAGPGSAGPDQEPRTVRLEGHGARWGAPAGPVPGAGTPAEPVPGGGTRAGPVPGGGIPAGPVPGGGAPSWHVPGGGAPAGRAPSGSTAEG